MAALFRLAEPEGTVRIDAVPITDISLRDLRSNLSIIPQVTHAKYGKCNLVDWVPSLSTQLKVESVKRRGTSRVSSKG